MDNQTLLQRWEENEPYALDGQVRFMESLPCDPDTWTVRQAEVVRQIVDQIDNFLDDYADPGVLGELY
jgi:hypothetical protein